jgi:hypothetical protein
VKEDGGTPGFPQGIKAALAISLKEKINTSNIHYREKELTDAAFSRLTKIKGLHFLADNIKDRLGIFSFYVDNVHHNLVTKILNDRFGIQVRGGCSCAGTYGHFLLNVDFSLSKKITDMIDSGDFSMKPGWIRLSLHPTMTNSELEYILDGIEQTTIQAEEWKKYRRILGQRNAVLKGSANQGELSTWTTALLEAGSAIDRQRRAYVDKLAIALASYGRGLLERPLTLHYLQGWRAELSLPEALKATEKRDRAFGNTEVGPHRADLAISIDGRRVHDEASRGQQKLAAAALILAQITVHAESRLGRSVLLIDDPAAELDSLSLERLLTALHDVPAQLVLTALTSAQLPPLPDFPVFHVERGEVHAL